MKNKALILSSIVLISIIHIGFIPAGPRISDPVLEQIKYEYANECYSDNQEMNEFYSCADLKKYIDKLEKQHNKNR